MAVNAQRARVRLGVGSALVALGIGGALSGIGQGTAAAATPSPTPTLASEAAAAQARLASTSAQTHAATLPLAHPDADHAGSASTAGPGGAPTATPAATPSATPAAAGDALGLDVSSYQGNVDWATARANGASFAYVKATENTDYTNSYFAQQYNGSAQAGLIRGAYHYAVPSNSSGAAQADYFVAHGGGWTPDGITLPGALDIESGTSEGLPECYGLSQSAMVSWVSSFVTEYRSLVGRNPVIYTGYYFWQDCTGGSSAFSATDPLWFPRYQAAQAAPVAPGWNNYAIWQYADSGTFPGDQNEFNGSTAALSAFATSGGTTSSTGPSCVGSLGAEPGTRPAVVGMTSTPDGRGYWMVDSAGGVAACGDAKFSGSPATLAAPVVGIAAGPDDSSYYLVGADGGVFTYGNAPFRGSAGNLPLTKPVVGMASDPAGTGYWLVAADGGVFNYGVPFYGSAGNLPLVKPVVGMASNASGTGYWLVASDGGIFTYNTPFYGSAGNLPLVKPVVGMAADRATGGYWMVASDGGIFTYNAPFYGSAGNIHLAQPMVGMASPPNGAGYWSDAADGGVFSYSVPFEGSSA
jgi:GH25 family lysozyme M1 (1,4-beta-N-acetylmuramidase)